MKTLSQINTEGRIAFEEGKDLESCPYSGDNSLNRYYWINEWRHSNSRKKKNYLLNLLHNQLGISLEDFTDLVGMALDTTKTKTY